MKRVLAAISVILVILIASCSSVFYGNISGRIIDADTGAAIENVTVYLYQDKISRDNAFAASKDTGTPPTSGYYTTALTGQDGAFSISRIYWKTNSPEYGKTADKSEVYLMYYKKGYGENGFTINANTALIISESSGGGVGEEKLSRTQNITNASLQVVNVLTDELVSDAISTAITTADESTLVRKINDRSYEITSLREADDPIISINWSFRDKENHYIPSDKDGIRLESGADSITAEEVFLYENPVITLYARPTKFTYPRIEGRLITSGLDKSLTDNITVTLEKEGRVIASAITENRPVLQGDESHHGSFTLEVPDTEYWYNSTYTGKNLTYDEDDLVLVFGAENMAPISVTFTSNELISGIKYISISYNSTSQEQQ